MKEYIEPNPKRRYYTCPHCNVYTRHDVIDAFFSPTAGEITPGVFQTTKNYLIHECSSCLCMICWSKGKMIYPETPIQEANLDMPESVKALYNEAGLIISKSPRAACALLRLAVEMLCHELGAHEKTINANISYLVSQGLPEKIQKALDIVRVVGNNAVHPGTITFDVDDESTALTLMKLLNLIVEKMITETKEIDAIFEALPESAKDAINKRDGNPSASSDS